MLLRKKEQKNQIDQRTRNIRKSRLKITRTQERRIKRAARRGLVFTSLVHKQLRLMSRYLVISSALCPRSGFNCLVCCSVIVNEISRKTWPPP